MEPVPAEPDKLLAEAARCRELATVMVDPDAVAALNQMAKEYEERATRLADDNRKRST